MIGATVHKTPEGEAAYRGLLALALRRVGFVRGLFLEAGFGEEEASERAELAYLAFGGFVELAGWGVQPAAFGLERLGELLMRMLFAPSLSENPS